MIYPTFKATVRVGKIQLVDDIVLPESAVLLITMLDETVLEALPLGVHLMGGLQDVLLGNITQIETVDMLQKHLDEVLGTA